MVALLVFVGNSDVLGREEGGGEDPLGDGDAVDAVGGGEGDGGGVVDWVGGEVVDAGGEEVD